VLSLESLVAWCRARTDVRLWVGTNSVRAEKGSDWYRDVAGLPFTPTSSYKDWQALFATAEIAHKALVLFLDRHREELGDPAVVSNLRTLEVKKDGSFIANLTEAGFYQLVSNSKGTAVTTKIPTRMVVTFRPWVGVEQTIEVEIAVTLDPDELTWKLTPITDLEEVLVQARTALRVQLAGLLPDAACFDGVPTWQTVV
jgi:hypothetical protein